MKKDIRTRLSAKSKKDRFAHSQSASYMVEMVVVPFVLLFALALPIMDLVTTTTRVTFLFAIARDAAFYAAKAKSFNIDISAKEHSAKNIASRIANMEAAGFTGIIIDSIETSILTTDINTKQTTSQKVQLAAAPNSDQYIYQIEVTLTGRVRPLLLFSNKFFGSIPGLSEWISVTVRSKEYCEYPQGLVL